VIDALAIFAQYLRVRHRRPFRTRRALEGWQLQAFDRLASQVLARSPFYQPYVGRALGEYPVIGKTIMMESFDRINTRGLDRDRLVELALRSEATRDFTPAFGEFSVGLSSGTSGRRSLFVTSRRERQLYAGGVLAKGLPGSMFRRHRIALLLRANNRLYTAARTGRISFAFFDLLAPFETLLGDLQTYQPDVLIGPPQILRLVAEAQRSRRVTLTPEKILAGAEVLEASDAEALRKAFGVRVDEIYQATEGFLGISCDHGTLHLNEDALLIERQWIDQSARCFMPIITDLVRSTQPIVRYRLDDVLVERAQPCPCGSILTGIERILGRADDILFLPRVLDNSLAAVMPDFVRDAMAHHHAVLTDYRVVQFNPDRIALRVEGPDPSVAWTVATSTLVEVFARQGMRQPTVVEGEPIQRDLGRKLRRVERRFKMPVLG
jgi:putative adenylate-forming enzyme